MVLLVGMVLLLLLLDFEVDFDFWLFGNFAPCLRQTSCTVSTKYAVLSLQRCTDNIGNPCFFERLLEGLYHFPSYVKRSSNKLEGMSAYSCKLSLKSNQWGLCRMKSEIIRLPTTEGGYNVQLQVATNDNCQCHLYSRKVRGLSKKVFSKVNAMVLSKPDLKPD